MAIGGAAYAITRWRKAARLEPGKPDEPTHLTPSKPPRPVNGLELVDDGHCSLLVVNDGPLLNALEERSYTLYGSIIPPQGKAEELLVSVLESSFPSCTWPPVDPEWTVEEEGARINWSALVQAQEASNAQWREEPQT